MAKTEVYVNKTLFEALGQTAERKGITRAAVLNKLLTDACVGNDKVKPVILPIPVELLNNKAGLKTWLEASSEKILNLLYQ